MPRTVVLEPLDKGLVTARNAVLLEPGEMPTCIDFQYLPNDPAPISISGRLARATITASTKIKSLFLLTFGGAKKDRLVAFAGHLLKSATYSRTNGAVGSVTTLFTYTASGPRSDSVAAGDAYYLLDGSNPPLRVAYAQGSSSTLEARTVGLNPQPEIGSVATTTGTWPSGALWGTGTYWFLVTEAYHPGLADEVESTFTGDPKSVQITDVKAQGVIVTRSITNTQYNPSGTGLLASTHWYVYISDRQDDGANVPPPLYTFKRLNSPLDIATTSVTFAGTTDVTTTTNQLFHYPTVSKVSGGTPPGGFTFIEWTSPNNMLTQNSTYASAVSDLSTTPPTTMAANEYYSFGFATVTTAVTGIRIQIIGYFQNVVAAGEDEFQDVNPSHQGFYISLVKGAGAGTRTAERFVQYDRENHGATNLYLGGADDLWGMSGGWAASDFVNGTNNFRVHIRYNSDFGAAQNKPITQTTYIDSIRADLYTQPTTALGTPITLTTGQDFPTVTIAPDVGPILSIGAYGKPPIASTGDVFQGQVVLNDTSRPQRIAYSLADQYEYFPSLYYLDLLTKMKDEVTVIRRVGSTLVVGMKNQVVRVNYLPSASDLTFSRGSVWDTIATDHGMVGPQACTDVTLPDMGTVLAYVSENGIHLTDGSTSVPINEDIDWGRTVAGAYIGNSILVNYPRKYQLWLVYTGVGLTTNSMALIYHYHPSHLKRGRPIVTQANHFASAACVGRYAGTTALLFGSMTTGNVSEEDAAAGTSLEVNATPVLETRLWYPGGIGSQVRVDGQYIHTSAYGTTNDTWGFILRGRKTRGAKVNLGTTTINTVVGGLQRFNQQHTTEAVQMALTYIASPPAALVQVQTMGLGLSVEDAELSSKT